MDNSLITILVENNDGSITPLEAPTDMGLSLMELLKANEFEVMATCGGMALCATCCVDILDGLDKLNEIGDDEYAMLDALPDQQLNSRLACQLRLTPEMDQLKIKIHATVGG